MKNYINENEYISITKHGGKMEGIPSISTNKYTNENCIKLMNNHNNNTICKFCFVDKVANQYKTLTNALQNNTGILTTRLLSKNEIARLVDIQNRLYVRFESFGDLNNEIQLLNYCNIAKFYKLTNFALWTKHFNILIKFFKNGHKLPKNLTLVLSAPLINKGLNKLLVEKIKTHHKNTITFEVVSDANTPGINCGGRKCMDCLNCYKPGKKHNVIELLK